MKFREYDESLMRSSVCSGTVKGEPLYNQEGDVVDDKGVPVFDSEGNKLRMER